MPARARGREASAISRMILVQGDVALVEQAQRLALAGAAHADLVALQPLQVENMQRLAAGHHHQVGNVDDVVDRPQAKGDQQLLHVGRRCLHRQVADNAAAVAPAVGRRLRYGWRNRSAAASQVHLRDVHGSEAQLVHLGGDFAGDAVVAKASRGDWESSRDPGRSGRPTIMRLGRFQADAGQQFLQGRVLQVEGDELFQIIDVDLHGVTRTGPAGADRSRRAGAGRARRT